MGCAVLSRLSCPTICNPIEYSQLAPLSMGSPRQEYWSEFPSPPPGDLSNRGIEPASPALAGSSLPLCHLRSLYSVRKECSVQFSSSVVSDSLWPHELQHARPPCPSPNPRVYSNSCPSSRWCHPTISSSVIPFSSRFQSFPTSGSFPVSQFFTSDGQSIGVSASASVLPVNIQNWFPLGLTGLISLLFKGLSRVFSNTPGSIRTRVKSRLWSVLLLIKEKFRELRTYDGVFVLESLSIQTQQI